MGKDRSRDEQQSAKRDEAESLRLTPEEMDRVLEGAKRDIEAAAAHRPTREPATPDEYLLSRLD